MIVGRRPELERLRLLLQQAGRGRTETVLIAGEAGMGKTTTIEALLDADAIADPSLRAVRGECVPLGGGGLPYAPIVGVVGELAARFGEAELIKWAGAGAAELGWMVPGLIPDGPEHNPTRIDGTQPETRIRLYETITRLLEEASRRGPLVLVIEDLHWADDSTRHLISYLLRVLTDAPLLMIFSYRTDELTRRHPLRPFLAEVTRLPTVHRMEIGPLEETPLTEMLEQVATDADPVLTRKIISSSGGVPYFAIELARASAGDGELPDTLRDTLLLRVSRVSEECQHMLRRLSIGGSRVDHELLAAVHDLGEPELEAVLREAVEANLLITDGTGYAFRHALMREAIHNDLLPGEHTRLHRLFGTVLQERPELLPATVRAVELAHHWSAARDNERAFRWSIEAARSQRYGFAEALQHYERALELWDAVSDPEAVAGRQPAVLDAAASAARNAGEAERALALINESLRLTDRTADPSAAAQRLANRSRMLHNLMQPGVLDTINEAVALVPAQPPSGLRADVLSRRASLTMLLDKAASVDLARAAIDASIAAEAPFPLAHAHITLGTALVGLGLDVEEGLAEFAAARSVIADQRDPILDCDESPLVRYHINYSDALTSLGRYRDALDVAVEGRELSARFGLERRSGVMLAGNAAEAAIALGEWQRARELVEWGQRMTPPGNHRVHQRLLLAELVIWGDDDLDRAEEILADLDRFARVDANGPDYIAQARRAKAALAWARDDWPLAWELARQLREDVPWWETTHDLMALGYAAMAYAGKSDPSPDWEQELRAGLQRPADSLIGRHWRPLIEAVLDGSVAHWEAAIATMIDAEAPQLNLSYARLRLAAALHHDHRPEDAVLVAEQVRADAERMGLQLLQRRVDTFVVDSGLGPPPGAAARSARRPESDGLPELTTREREVLALVADGLSNRQIGDRLVISTKTASVHVSNILAKLEVASRGAAAAHYRDAGS